MDQLRKSFKNNGVLHHAYALAGQYASVKDEVVVFLRDDCGFLVAQNSDVQFSFSETFGIDESRALEASAHRKAFASSGKFFIVGCETLTHEAQNALLKLFEDPPIQTTFFLIIPSHAQLFPTLRSRLYLLESESYGEEVNTSASAKFLAAVPGVRLELVSKMIEGKDRTQAVQFVNGLEELVYKSTSEERVEALRSLAKVRTYLPDRSSSLKLILEHLSLVLPVKKV